MVHLSAPAVKERIEKLEERKVIQGYSLVTNSEALGYAISGFVQANIITGKEMEFRQIVESSSAVTQCFNVTGEKAYIFKVVIQNMSELDRLLERLSTVCKTETSLILSETIAPRLPTDFHVEN